MKELKVITMRFTPDEHAQVKQAAENELRSVTSFCKHLVLASLPRASTITVKRDDKGKFIKLEEK